MLPWINVSTFHYGSIKINNHNQSQIFYKYLHSTMVLLKYN